MRDEDYRALLADNDRLFAENTALRKELSSQSMAHMTQIGEIMGGYDTDLDEATWPGYTNFKLRKQIHELEQEVAKLKACIMQQAIVKGYGT